MMGPQVSSLMNSLTNNTNGMQEMTAEGLTMVTDALKVAKAVSLTVRPAITCLTETLPTSLKDAVSAVMAAVDNGGASVDTVDEVFSTASTGLQCVADTLLQLKAATGIQLSKDAQQLGAQVESTASLMLKRIEQGAQITDSLLAVFKEVMPLLPVLEKVGLSVSKVIAANGVTSEASRSSAIGDVMAFRSQMEALQVGWGCTRFECKSF
jgi:hypothetical protein